MASAIAKHPYGSRMSKQTNELPEQLKLMSPFHERNKPPPLPGVVSSTSAAGQQAPTLVYKCGWARSVVLRPGSAVSNLESEM